jgi:hypothetical protein
MLKVSLVSCTFQEIRKRIVTVEIWLPFTILWVPNSKVHTALVDSFNAIDGIMFNPTSKKAQD